MEALPISQPFRKPVSRTDFPKYYQYVITPMDLSTVHKKLDECEYKSMDDFSRGKYCP